jgi:hypothetical protein
MRNLMVLLVLLCGTATAYAAGTAAWCDGKDRLTADDKHFYLNGVMLPNFSVTDATEEDGIEAYEYNGRLFLPCEEKKD